ncbi:MAG: zinc-ribbon domain-containing protein [Candidatus Lernaella stagnicola]|nr:zinc-ribbon domain-containing protein [Candidatus Lernaella stagnicola]
MARCQSCGAEISEGINFCPYCGAADPVRTASAESGSQVVKVDDNGGLSSKSAGGSGFGREMKTFSCNSCGAKVSYDPALKTLACAYCGSTYVIEKEAKEETERPGRIVPFMHNQHKAEELFWTWLGKGFFRPRDLTKKSAISEIRGMYMPFYAFDADVDSQWSADSGYFYYEKEPYSTKDSEGRTVTKYRDVQKTRWQPATGQHAAHYDEWLVSASKGLDQEWVHKISPFPMADARSYNSDYLAGFAAENPSIVPRDAQQTAGAEMQQAENAACDNMVPGDTSRNLRVDSVFRHWHYDLVMLPLWISAYRYKGKVFRFLVNGQTGEVQGNAPFSWLKLILLILGIAGAAGVIALLYDLFGH